MPRHRLPAYAGLVEFLSNFASLAGSAATVGLLFLGSCEALATCTTVTDAISRLGMVAFWQRATRRRLERGLLGHGPRYSPPPAPFPVLCPRSPLPDSAAEVVLDVE